MLDAELRPMATIVPDKTKIKSFSSETAFEEWLGKNHAREAELWLRIYKKDSGVPTVTNAQAIDVALCWGWIDGIRKALDASSFLQRFTPRRAKSIWSQINQDNIARLSAAGRMTPHGQRQVDAAKADGRWDAAYAPMRSATEATLPADLRAAIRANPRAQKKLRTLGRMNLFSLSFRTNNMKTPAGRAKKIAELVAMLARGESIRPEAQRPRARSGTGSTLASREAGTSPARRGGMASKKLAPKAGRLANPSVGVRRAKHAKTDGEQGTDGRSPTDRDGNEQQARARRSDKSDRKAAPARSSSVARRRSGG